MFYITEHMKYSDLVPAPKVMVRRATAVAMLEHEAYLNRFIELGWVRPLPSVDSNQQCAMFTVDSLQKAVARLEREGWPNVKLVAA